MTTLRIPERTLMEEVLSWDMRACEVIRLSRRSSFESGAQGLAIAGLASIDPKLASPVLLCDFEEPATLAAFDDTPFASAFGFAVVRLVKTIVFNNGIPSSATFKARLGELYKTKEGILGSGTSISVVSPDPVFSLPPALTRLGTGDEESYPPPSSFQALLTRVVQSMGFRRLLGSAAETSVIEFVYEALRNSQEHGITSELHRRARSTRALIVEKVVLQGNMAARGLSSELRDYLDRILEANRDDLGLGVVCLTVTDQGDGIQETLPSRGDESPEARLARAFEPGESRKPAGVVKRGLGLPSVVASAHRLQALVRITSGSLQVGQDFSMAVSRYPKLDFDRVRHLAGGRRGTCVSIFFPEFGFDIDQKPLFGR